MNKTLKRIGFFAFLLVLLGTGFHVFAARPGAARRGRHISPTGSIPKCSMPTISNIKVKINYQGIGLRRRH